MSIRTTFPEAAFFAENPARQRSLELDFGVMWRDGDRPWPTYRVSYIKDTGEFYAIQLAGVGAGTVELLGSIDPAGGYDAAEKILDGWADLDALMLDWARARMAG